MQLRALVIAVVLLLGAAPMLAQAVEVSPGQMMLCHDASSGGFLDRVQYAIVSQALVIKAESVGIANHAQRQAMANGVLVIPQTWAALMCVGIVGSVNLQGTVTIVNGVASTSVTDAALLSQVATLWNGYAVP